MGILFFTLRDFFEFLPKKQKQLQMSFCESAPGTFFVSLSTRSIDDAMEEHDTLSVGDGNKGSHHFPKLRKAIEHVEKYEESSGKVFASDLSTEGGAKSYHIFSDLTHYWNHVDGTRSVHDYEVLYDSISEKSKSFYTGVFMDIDLYQLTESEIIDFLENKLDPFLDKISEILLRIVKGEKRSVQIVLQDSSCVGEKFSLHILIKVPGVLFKSILHIRIIVLLALCELTLLTTATEESPKSFLTLKKDKMWLDMVVYDDSRVFRCLYSSKMSSKHRVFVCRWFGQYKRGLLVGKIFEDTKSMKLTKELPKSRHILFHSFINVPLQWIRTERGNEEEEGKVTPPLLLVDVNTGVDTIKQYRKTIQERLDTLCDEDREFMTTLLLNKMEKVLFTAFPDVLARVEGLEEEEEEDYCSEMMDEIEKYEEDERGGVSGGSSSSSSSISISKVSQLGFSGGSLALLGETRGILEEFRQCFITYPKCFRERIKNQETREAFIQALTAISGYLNKNVILSQTGESHQVRVLVNAPNGRKGLSVESDSDSLKAYLRIYLEMNDQQCRTTYGLSKDQTLDYFAALVFKSITITFITNSHFCFIKGGKHKSNHVYYVCDMKGGNWCQGCHNEKVGGCYFTYERRMKKKYGTQVELAKCAKTEMKPLSLKCRELCGKFISLLFPSNQHHHQELELPSPQVEESSTSTSKEEKKNLKDVSELEAAMLNFF